jgi:hypothetical protein
MRTRTQSIQQDYVNKKKELNRLKETKGLKGKKNRGARIWNKFLELGLWGQNHADWMMTTIGWTAVYEETRAKELKAGAASEAAEAAAIKAADKATMESQPSISTWNTVEAFQPGSGVWRGLMMFGVPLNRLYNMWQRLPAAARDGNMRYVIGYSLSMAISGLICRAMFGYFAGDDDDRKKTLRKAVFAGLAEPVTATLPFGVVSNNATWLAERLIVGEKRMRPQQSIFPVVDTAVSIPGHIIDWNEKELLKDAAKMLGYTYGVPAAEINRFINAGFDAKNLSEIALIAGGMKDWID